MFFMTETRTENEWPTICLSIFRNLKTFHWFAIFNVCHRKLSSQWRAKSTSLLNIFIKIFHYFNSIAHVKYWNCTIVQFKWMRSRLDWISSLASAHRSCGPCFINKHCFTCRVIIFMCLSRSLIWFTCENA